MTLIRVHIDLMILCFDWIRISVRMPISRRRRTIYKFVRDQGSQIKNWSIWIVVWFARARPRKWMILNGEDLWMRIEFTFFLQSLNFNFHWSAQPYVCVCISPWSGTCTSWQMMITSKAIIIENVIVVSATAGVCTNGIICNIQIH